MSKPRVEMEIVQGKESWGRIVLELEPDLAPKTVENFLSYVDKKYFDGTIFHRVIPEFMIQGGGYTAPSKSKGGLQPPVQNEAAKGLKNEKGVIAMARTNDAHSATSQFFINVANNRGLDHPGHDGWGYCGFGRVIEGMEVVTRIENVPTTRNPQMGEDSQPSDPPIVKSARRAAVK